MTTLNIVDLTIVICVSYLIYLFSRQKYRLLVPSTIHTITWLMVVVLIHFTMSGDIGHYNPTSPLQSYNNVAPFILGLTISSIVGFSLSHLLVPYSNAIENEDANENYIEYIDWVLKKYRWILYVNLFLGILQIVFLVSAVGWNNIGDYRIAAVTLERTGIGKFANMFSGHAMFLGVFYIALLAYKQSYAGINLKVLLKDIFMLAFTNIAIAGRAWIITTLLPYFIVYFWQQNQQGKKFFSKDIKTLAMILVIAMSAFSLIGLVRGSSESVVGHGFFDKFLYYTDGTRITNNIMQKYPDGSFEYEYGQSEFLYRWAGSPMWEKYIKSISDDIGLLVTVPSHMPYLYFDYGFWGGIVMWAILCFIIESIATRLRNRNSIINVFLFMLITRLFFATPISSCFMGLIPAFEWLIILYFFRNRLFPNYKEQYQ